MLGNISYMPSYQDDDMYLTAEASASLWNSYQRLHRQQSDRTKILKMKARGLKKVLNDRGYHRSYTSHSSRKTHRSQESAVDDSIRLSCESEYTIHKTNLDQMTATQSLNDDIDDESMQQLSHQSDMIMPIMPPEHSLINEMNSAENDVPDLKDWVHGYKVLQNQHSLAQLESRRHMEMNDSPRSDASPMEPSLILDLPAGITPAPIQDTVVKSNSAPVLKIEVRLPFASHRSPSPRSSPQQQSNSRPYSQSRASTSTKSKSKGHNKLPRVGYKKHQQPPITKTGSDDLTLSSLDIIDTTKGLFSNSITDSLFSEEQREISEYVVDNYVSKYVVEDASKSSPNRNDETASNSNNNSIGTNQQIITTLMSSQTITRPVDLESKMKLPIVQSLETKQFKFPQMRQSTPPQYPSNLHPIQKDVTSMRKSAPGYVIQQSKPKYR